MMPNYRQAFLKFALASEVLRFGQFTLKSGRVSPYFFNAGLFNTGAALARLGRFYAQAIVDADIAFDILYGPAYKGIPLAAVTAAALYEHHQQDLPYAFNRKEAKAHGEGGMIVGHPLQGQRVLIIDDVITAGTAVRESMDIIQAQEAECAGVVIALDRQERGQGALSAIQEVETEYGISVAAIANLQDLQAYLAEEPDSAEALQDMQVYQSAYGLAG